ncbi:MAG: hypothetical protein AB7E96_10090 [Deferribacterales bacterium]
MKIIFFCLSCLFSFSCFAGEYITYAPEHVAEYENFRFQIASELKFRVDISNPCVSIQKVTGVVKEGDKFVSGNGRALIYFDNKCFENTEVTITIESGRRDIKRYKIEPRIVEQHDMGC